MERRRFLLTLAAGLAAVSAGHGVLDLEAPEALAGTRPRRPTTRPKEAARAVARPARFGPPDVVPVSPPRGVVDGLPGDGRTLAVTVDDGVSSAVVQAFVTLARDTGIRLTFFPNGCYRSWQKNAAGLRRLADSGQVAFGNHTWSHPDVTTLSDRDLAEEIRRNRQFLDTTFGAGGTPFFRPPYGRHDARTDRIAADLGHPTVALWNGTLGDNVLLTPAELLDQARRWFTARTIVVGHANHPTVTHVYGELLDLIRERSLQTATLADIWASPESRVRGARASGQGTVR